MVETFSINQSINLSINELSVSRTAHPLVKKTCAKKETIFQSRDLKNRETQEAKMYLRMFVTKDNQI